MSISTDKSLTPEALVSVGLVLFPTHPQGPSREADGQAPVEGGGHRSSIETWGQAVFQPEVYKHCFKA